MVKKKVFPGPAYVAGPLFHQGAESYNWQPQENHMGCTVGVTPFPEEGEDVTTRKEMLQIFTKDQSTIASLMGSWLSR